MIVERDVDCGALYGDERRAFVELLRTAPSGALAAVVPATPAWTVHDVLAHLVGIAADLNAGRFPQRSDPDAWTAQQVDDRRGASVEEMASEWEREAPQFEDGLRLLGYEIGSHYVGDLLLHAADVRSAIGAPQIPDGDALAVGTDFYVDDFHQRLCAAGAGRVTIDIGDEVLVVGAGDSELSLRAARFEVFRTVGGRRSERQVRSLPWTGDVDAVLPFVSRYPLPTSDIVDP